MSLLLQALKKAEESKRQREQKQEESALAPEMELPKELDYPKLDEPKPLESMSDERIEPTFDLKFEQEEMGLAEVEVQAVPESAMTLDFEPVSARTPLHRIDPDLEPEPVSVAAPIPAPAEVPPPSVASPLAAAKPVEPASVPAPPALALEAKPAEAASQLLTAPKAKSGRNMAPWLVLGGCVLLGGMGAWIWWQIQEVSYPLTAPGQPPALEASAPEAVTANPDGGTSTPSASFVAVLTPLPISGSQASSVAAMAAPSAMASVPLAAAQASPVAALPAIKPSTVSRPPAGNKAAYIEPQAAPVNQPKIERQIREAAIPPALEAAWNAFQQGDLATAETQYRRMLASDARSRDAMLGLAAIAARKGQKQEAASWYKRLLALNPQDEDAQAGLLAADPDSLSERNEARLLQQGDRVDSPLLLGQYYASRNRWHEAQEQYFRAFAQNPTHADLAFNLAVSLDHIKQSRLAAEYYRKALKLPGGSFDRGSAEKRLEEIMAGPR